MGEECGQCINYTTGWLGIPPASRVPIVRESPRVCTRVIRACVRACVRAYAWTCSVVPTCSNLGYIPVRDRLRERRTVTRFLDVCVIEKVKINRCTRIISLR